MSADAVILSAVRTPIGKFQGALAGIPATQLGAHAVRAAVERAGIQDTEIDEVILGNVVQAGLGQAPARQAAIGGGIASSVGATAVNKVCGSGLKAVMLAAQAIRAGDSQLMLAGGFESMSRAPHLFAGRGKEHKHGNQQLTDSLLNDGLWDPFENWGMGEAAEFIAHEYGITRDSMDTFALSSHQKAVAAQKAGSFRAEIIPIYVSIRKGEAQLVSTDEGPREGTSIEALQALKPAFTKDGLVTAGNSSTMNDGAAIVVVASSIYARSHNLTPIARIAGYAQAAVEPKYLFAAPGVAIPKLLDRIGWQLRDVDLLEINEAFAAQVLTNARQLHDLGWDGGRLNVNGGAIALGHPLGASGARILTTLVHALRARNAKRGIAALCLGGGEAVALAVEIQ